MNYEDTHAGQMVLKVSRGGKKNEFDSNLHTQKSAFEELIMDRLLNRPGVSMMTSSLPFNVAFFVERLAPFHLRRIYKLIRQLCLSPSIVSLAALANSLRIFIQLQ